MTISPVYLGTDVDVALTVTGVDLSTATEIEFLLRKTGATDILLLKTTGGIVVSSATVATVSIPKAIVTIAGAYAIRLSVTESSGKERGLNLDVKHLVYE